MFAYIIIRGLAITAGYHRLWSHRTYTASMPLKLALAIIGASAGHGSIKFWSRGHRAHHRFVDTDKDPYNIQNGLFSTISDGFCSIIPKIALRTSGFVIVGIIGTSIIQQGTFCINSFGHWAGPQPYTSAKSPCNNFFTALITFAEGYHNFHHEFPIDYRNEVRFYDYDPTKWLIWMTWEEYKQQTRTGCNLIVIKGVVHEVSAFVTEHPGGSSMITGAIGKDATEMFEGPILRITPNEIHINDVGFLDTIYAPHSVPRNKYEGKLKSLRMPGGVGTTADYKLHKIRRNSLAPFFSKRNILTLENLIAKKVDQLCGFIKTHTSTETPVNLSDLFFALSNDVTTNFLSSHQVDVLRDERNAATLRHNSHNLLQCVHLNRHFPWVPDLIESLPEFISKPMVPSGLLDMHELFGRVNKELVAIIEDKSNAVQKTGDLMRKKSVYEAILDDPNLPDSQKALKRLEEGSLLVLAGAESPAATLNLPYLSAVIKEGNRLSFSVAARTSRIAPGPITYTPSHPDSNSAKTLKSYVIPGGTPVSISTLSAHTASSIFPDPYKFDPDRWLGEEGRERRKFQMAFGKGGRKCLGIELARAELCLVVARLVQRFDMTLWRTDATDVAFLHEFVVAMPKLNSKGVQVLVKNVEEQISDTTTLRKKEKSQRLLGTL
ncbi:cytochrome P450 [Penicillium herquei]|nr:cytochrome P450 [Penicillium herquei]